MTPGHSVVNVNDEDARKEEMVALSMRKSTSEQ